MWVELPAVGLSGGIIVGCDSSKFIVEKHQVHQFSVTLFIKNRIDAVQWCLTVVYGPVNNSLKAQFWEELHQIGTNCYDAWLICGDFNTIRYRHEKTGTNFHMRASKRFNTFIENFSLFE